MLVSDGGRPCYPIALVQAFSENIDAYPGLAEPWLRNGWEVFDIQLDHWHRFLQWQQLIRGTYDSRAAYDRHARKYKLLLDLQKSSEAQELEADPLHLMEYWKRVEARENPDWKHLANGDNLPPLIKGQPFLTHVEVVKYRLSQRGVAHTVQLKGDVKQQDKLSTWLEYLAYQYAWCDRYARQLKRRQLKFDKEWERLVASGVLHDWETADYLDTDASGFERQDQVDTAHVAIIHAEKAVKALVAEIEKSKQDPGNPRLQELERSLAEAKSKESSARQAYKVVMARHDPIDRFLDKAMNYRETQRNIQKNGELAQWILDQLSLVEAELSEDGTPESGPSPARSPVSRTTARQTPPPQSAHDAGRKARSGRVTKKSAQRRTDARSPRSESARAGASPPSGPGPRRLDPESNTGVGSAVQPRKGQRKVYQKERASLRRLWRRRCRPLQGRRRRASPHRVAKRCPRPRLRVVRSLGGSQSPGLGLFDKGYAGLWLETTDKVRHRGHSLPLLHCHGCENFKILFPRRGYGFLLSFHRAGVSFPSYHGSLFASFEEGEEENGCGCKWSQGQH